MPLKVFIVEDSIQVRERLTDFIAVPGEIEVIGYAKTAQEAVEALNTTPYDAAIIDLQLQEGNGLEVIEKVRMATRQAALASPPKLIVFTNHPFDEIKKRALQLGADYFFDKSVDYENMKSTLHALHKPS